MKSLIGIAKAVLLAIVGIASAQTPNPTVDSYIATAKAAARTDWAGTFVRLCIPPSAAPQATGGGQAGAGRGAGGRGTALRTPARETWFAEPAKVADNLYFLGTKIHSAWAIVGSQGIIVIEALFEYAARDEILDGLKKVGLDPKNVKYVILSHAHADHDGGPCYCRTLFRAPIIYGAEAARQSMTWWALTG